MTTAFLRDCINRIRTYAYNSLSGSRFTARGRLANLALQFWLGLLSERRLRTGASHCSRISAYQAPLIDAAHGNRPRVLTRSSPPAGGIQATMRGD